MNAREMEKEIKMKIDPAVKAEEVILLKKDFRVLKAVWICQAEDVEDCVEYSPAGDGGCSFLGLCGEFNLCLKEVS